MDAMVLAMVSQTFWSGCIHMCQSMLKLCCSAVYLQWKDSLGLNSIEHCDYTALPFVGVRLTQPKPQSELESIRLKNKQLGVEPAAGAGEAAASHAGRLSILQPHAGELAEAGPSQPHGDAQQQPHRGGVRHLPLLMQCAHSTENLGVIPHKQYGYETVYKGF